MTLSSIIRSTAGLQGYWPCADSVGSASLVDVVAGRNVTLGSASKAGMHGLDQWSPGSVRYDGGSSNNTGTIAYNAALYPLIGSFECCIRMSQEKRGTFRLWSRADLATGGNAYYIEMFDDGVSQWLPQLGQGSGGTILCRATAGTPFTDTHQFHHLMVVWDDTLNTVVIYVDGIDRSGAVTAPAFGSGNVQNFLLGSDFQAVNLLQVAIYNAKLTSADALARANALAQEQFQTNKQVSFGYHNDAMYYGTALWRQSILATSASINGKVTRNTMLWELVEPTNGAVKDWTIPDQIVQLANSYGMIPLWILAGSPTWANGGADRWAVPGTGVDATFTAWVDKYVSFATAFVNRYKPGGTGPQTIASPFYVEMWNEPNLAGFWNGQYNADQYSNWYRRVSAACRAEYPACIPVFGALSSWEATGGGTSSDGNTFMRSVIASSQWQNAPILCASYHAYSANNNPDDYTSFDNHFNDPLVMRDALAELGYPNCPLALSEQGITTATSQVDQSNKLSIMVLRVRDEWRQFCPFYCTFIPYSPSYLNYSLFNSENTDGSPSTDKRPAATMFQAAKYWINPSNESLSYGKAGTVGRLG